MGVLVAVTNSLASHGKTAYQGLVIYYTSSLLLMNNNFKKTRLVRIVLSPGPGAARVILVCMNVRSSTACIRGNANRAATGMHVTLHE